MLDLSYRLATDQDADELFHIHQRAVRELCVGAYTTEHIVWWFDGRTPSIYDSALSAGHIWVAEDSVGQILGFVGAEPGEVTLLFVRPEVAHRGVGAQLFKFALARAEENWLGAVVVVATINSAPFYQRFGFIPVEAQSFVRGPHELRYPVIRMERQSEFVVQGFARDA